MTRTLLGMVGERVDELELAGRFCRECVAGLGVDGAALSLLTLSSSRVTLAATDPVADLLEDLQFTLNEGACIEAAATGAPVLVPDLSHSASTARWPVFAAALAERSGVAALFALPLQWGAVNLGVLDLYRLAPGPLGAERWADAAEAADTAALLLLDLRTDPAGDAGALLGAVDSAAGLDGAAGLGPGDFEGDWLDTAVGVRAEIHQATGMVLAQLGVSAIEALARMRGHAFSHQRLLLDVAHDVVERRLVFTDQMP